MRPLVFCFLTGFSCWMLLSCSGKYTVQEYLEKVEKNEEYTKEYSNSNYIVSCKYMPTEVLAITEANNSGDSPQEKQKGFEIAKKNFENSAYFTLTLKRRDGANMLMQNVQDQAEYAQRLNYVTNSMHRDFFVVREAGDTVKAQIYDYQRSYGNSPNVVMLFAFPKAQTIGNGEKELHFFYKDHLFGISSVVRLIFNNDKLKEEDPDITF